MKIENLILSASENETCIFIWFLNLSLFKTLKMYPFQLLVAAYYNQTVFYQFLPLCCRLALCHFTGFYTYATMQKITTAKMWANKQKRKSYAPPSFEAFLPWPKNCHFNKFGFISVIFKICKQILFVKLFFLDYNKNRKCINNFFLFCFYLWTILKVHKTEKRLKGQIYPPAPPSHFKDL